MEIYWFNKLSSTQLYLLDALKNGTLTAPVAVVAKYQTDGIGSRGNRWIGYEGGLFLSFALKLDSLPNDLNLASASIYFGYLTKEYLNSLGSKVWLKWPNDLYIDDKKIGGIITKVFQNTIVCGIGINLKNSAKEFGILDIDVELNSLVLGLLERFEKGKSWKQIFRNFSVEFYQSLTTGNFPNSDSFKEAILLEDGSLEINKKRVYSLR